MTDRLIKSNIDGYGFARSDSFDNEEFDKFMSTYLSVMARRAMKWNAIVGKRTKIAKSAKVKRYCRKGIPAEHRPMVWMCITGAQRKLELNRNVYKQMSAAKHDQDLIETIQMDIHRTFPNNLYFCSDTDAQSLRKPLYNVLIAVGHKNSTKGYCQGMNYIAALLLLTVKNEEKVFWLMDSLMNDLLPDYYSPDMKAIKIDQEVLGELVKWKQPDVYKHLEDLDLSWSIVGMKWFICLFADVLPVDTVLRIWDCLFYEGSKILMRVSLELIRINRLEILACANFSELTDLFKNMVMDKSTLHCHTFIQDMFESSGSLPMARINRMREECAAKI